MNVDRSAPDLELSGALYERRGEELGEGSYELRVDARDGQRDSGSPTDERSGVRSLDVLLDGESVEFSQQECPQGSCALGGSFEFDTAERPGGGHVVEVIAEDHLGHQRRESFTFESGPCCGADPSAWGSAPGSGPVVFGDVDGDARDDALVRDPLSGEVEVGLSDGSGFGAFESWGTLAAFQGLGDLALGDANYDGLADLVGRDPATGAVWVAASNGSAFEAPTVWGSWPVARTLEVADVDGDGSVDLAGRAALDGRIYVGYSDDTAFEGALGFTDYPIAASDEWYLADVDSDFGADLVVRSGDSVSVGLYDDSTFGALSVFGTLPAARRALFGDVNGDGAADMLGYDQTDQTVTLSASRETSFAAPRRFGSFPAGYRLSAIDADASGQADIAGQRLAGTELRVALTDMAAATGPAAGDWEPDPGVVYDEEDETEPADDPEVDLEDPSGERRAAAQRGTAARSRSPMRLGFQDERRLNRRFQIPDPSSTDPTRPYIPEPDAYGSRAAETDGLLEQRIFSPLKAAGGDADPTSPKPQRKPIMRFIVLWGQIENRPGTVVGGVPQRWYFDKLDRAIDQARAQGFHVYLTLSGLAKDFECNRNYNFNGRACAEAPGGPERPTGRSPDPEQFGEFAAAVAGRYKGKVAAYGIWNEPNNSVFLKKGDRHDAVDGLYRRLYLAAYNRIKRRASYDEGLGYKNARVFFGELSHLTSSVRACAGCRRKSISALRFLEQVVEPSPGSDALIRTHGVAWHPYQHAGPPDRRGINAVVGIGRAEDIQGRLDKLAKRPDGGGPRPLVTPRAKRPRLFSTEFGYFNGPYPPRTTNPDCPKDAHRCGTKYYKTEAGRADLYRRALSRAYHQGAKWTIIYQATEISPDDYAETRKNEAEPPTPDEAYMPEYGLFSPKGEVTGTRPYGKGPSEFVTKNTQPRMAFCAIYDWASIRDYGVGQNPCATGP